MAPARSNTATPKKRTSTSNVQSPSKKRATAGETGLDTVKLEPASTPRRSTRKPVPSKKVKEASGESDNEERTNRQSGTPISDWELTSGAEEPPDSSPLRGKYDKKQVMPIVITSSDEDLPSPTEVVQSAIKKSKPKLTAESQLARAINKSSKDSPNIPVSHRKDSRQPKPTLQRTASSVKKSRTVQPEVDSIQNFLRVATTSDFFSDKEKQDLYQYIASMSDDENYPKEGLAAAKAEAHARLQDQRTSSTLNDSDVGGGLMDDEAEEDNAIESEKDGNRDVEENEDTLGDRGAYAQKTRSKGASKDYKGKARAGPSIQVPITATQTSSSQAVSQPERASSPPPPATATQTQSQPNNHHILVRNLQHPKLYSVYDNIPLDALYAGRTLMVATGTTTAKPPYVDSVSFTGVFEALSTQEQQRLMAAMTMDVMLPFIPTARLGASSFQYHNDAIYYVDTSGRPSAPAVFLTVGLVSVSELDPELDTGSTNFSLNNPQRYVSVSLFEQDYSVFEYFHGRLVNEPVYHTQLTGNGAVSFSTKKYLFQSNKKGTPQKPSRFRSQRAHPQDIRQPEPAASSSATQIDDTLLGHEFKPYRKYDEGIPVYDGRGQRGNSGFMSTLRDWRTYDALPRYEDHENIPQDTVVIVGYTVSHYQGMNRLPFALVTPNAQFIIVIGQPIE